MSLFSLSGGAGGSSSGGANPAGSGSELQYRSNGTTFGALTGSSVSGANLTLGGNLGVGKRLLGVQGADVASSTDLGLGDGNYFKVTGSTQIEGIFSSGWTGGSIVVLTFATTVTVNHNGSPDIGDPFLLAGSTPMIATANDTLTVIYDAVNSLWREISRSVI